MYCVNLCFLITGFAAAADLPWYLQNRAYFEPLLADPRAAQIQILFPAFADSFPYAVNPGRSQVWDISVGHEFPIIGWESNSSVSPIGVAAGAFGIGFWFPISFHMIEDIGKDPSAPILNTDYRFGGQVKAQYGLPWGWTKRSHSHIGLRFQSGHESTHIGDEFTINAIRKYGGDFLRVNVSYEYYDLAGSFEPNFGKDSRHRLKLRGGAMWLWHPERGWYSEDILVYPFGTAIAPSRRNYEPYAGAEFLWTFADKNGEASDRAVITSIDIRDRTIFKYQTVLVRDERSEISVNAIAGLRHQRGGGGPLGKISPTYYIRYYHGVNPNGQFRSQSNFTEFGIGMQLGF